MKVILLTNIPKTGKKYEVKDVADGHAINFLIPRKMAEIATPAKITQLESKKARGEKEQALQAELFKKDIESLAHANITLSLPANEKGHLFKGVHQDDISDVCKKEHNITIDPKYILMEEPIKEIGTKKIVISNGEVKDTINIEILAQQNKDL